MRKFMILGALVGMMLAAMALPAFADDLNDQWEERGDESLEELFFDGFFFPGFFFDEDEDFDGLFFDEDEDFDGFDFDGELNQDVEQEAESGDIDQSFTVTGGGDNSNQCVGVQGVANTGNAQNVTDVTQLGAQEEDDDFFDLFDGDEGDLQFDEVGSTIEVSPTNTTSCEQQVNQAASATG